MKRLIPSLFFIFFLAFSSNAQSDFSQANQIGYLIDSICTANKVTECQVEYPYLNIQPSTYNTSQNASKGTFTIKNGILIVGGNDYFNLSKVIRFYISRRNNLCVFISAY